MAYINPIPNVDDEYVSEKYCVTFSFSSAVTLEEAHKGINDLIKNHGGEVPVEWIKMGHPKNLRRA